MAGESLVQVTEGSGKKLHTWQRTIGANSVEDEYVLIGEQGLAAYGVATGSSVSIATANDHIFQLMAGASLNVFVRRIRVFQTVVATTAALIQFHLLRLSTAGTGGTAITPSPFDSADAASGATFMTLPTVKGTEGVRLGMAAAEVTQTVPTGGSGQAALLAEWDFDKLLRTKAVRIPSGAANGICLKNINATAGASVQVEVILTEANYA